MNKKIITAALIASAFAIGLAGCGNAASAASASTDGTVFRTVEEIQKSGTIRIGVFSDKAPFGYVDDQGKYQGYDVVYARRIAEDLNVEPEFVSLDPSNRVEFVNTGKVDITLANFTVTAERAEKVDFAKPYMKVMLGVVSPDSNVITDLSQLEDSERELIIAKGTTAESYFETNYPKIRLQKYDAYADAYNALLDGRGAAFSTDNTEVLAWANANPGFEVGIMKLGSVDTIAAAVAKGNSSLLEYLNREIADLGSEQFFHKDYQETLQPVYGDTANPDDIVVEGGSVE